MAGSVSVVIPAKDEEGTVAHVIRAIGQATEVDEVVVVAHRCTDRTAQVAAETGARVVTLETGGFGAAVKAGIRAAHNDLIFKIDADISNTSSDWVRICLQSIAGGECLAKGYWRHEPKDWPMAHVMVRPVLEQLFPDLPTVHLPTSGIYLLDRRKFDVARLRDDWSLDVQVVIEAHYAGSGFSQCYLDEVEDRIRPASAYQTVTREILDYLLGCAGTGPQHRLTAVFAHCDDAEIWCGGTFVKLLAQGVDMTWVIATCDPIRRQEAERTAALWPNLSLVFLEAADMQAFDRAEDTIRLRDILEHTRPHVVITHHPGDLHRDHQASYRAVQAALLMCGEAVRPTRILACNSYFFSGASQPAFVPDTVVDISGQVTAKHDLIRHHASQEPEHWVEMSTRMDSLLGLRTGVAAAEGFQTMGGYALPVTGSLFSR
jgi:LmbE family N-acetylglucosaminyl deacetylase